MCKHHESFRNSVTWDNNSRHSSLCCSEMAMGDHFNHGTRNVCRGKEQYELLKTHFMQQSPLAGIREYYNRTCWLGMDIDSGPIIFNLSPSGTAFAIGAATYFGDTDFRNSLLKTGEIAGSTVRGWNTNHYLLANMALVGEAITLAMRTSVPWHNKTNENK